MKTHYATVDKANESNNHDEWHTTLCGLEETESPLDDNIKYVSCKKCLKRYNKLFMPKNQYYALKMVNRMTPNGWVEECHGTALFYILEGKV